MSVKAYVLIEIEPGTALSVVRALRKFPKVKFAYAVAGPYDVIADVEALDMKQMNNLVLKQIQKTDGVTRTMTLFVMDDI